MSLALFRERIEAGEVDEAVRAHLRGCAECRAHYDLLVRTARALGDDGSARERARLLEALPRPADRRLLWLPVGAIAALLLAVIAASQRPRESDVVMRGTADPGGEAPFSLRVYGKDAPGQPVRLIADFPGAKEASVGLRAELQYFVKPGNTRIIVETRGTQKTLTARAAGATVDLAPVGRPFPVGAFGPGNIEVCAAAGPPSATTLDEAVKAGAAKYCSTLLVSP